MVLMSAAMVGMFFILTLYQQQVQGYSAVQAGLAQVPLGVVLIGLAGAAGPLVERIGVKPTLLAGLALFAGGIAWLSQITADGSYLTDVLGPSLVIGAGLGARVRGAHRRVGQRCRRGQPRHRRRADQHDPADRRRRRPRDGSAVATARPTAPTRSV